MVVIITGGAGFIGSALIRQILTQTDWQIINVDKLTYAGNLESLKEIEGNSRYRFLKIDIREGREILQLFEEERPDAIIHLAAESHVDRSIDGPADFIQTNIVGTCTLLEAARAYWKNLPEEKKESFRFHHVSTDEVYGSLGEEGSFKEDSPYRPNSPYAASKAASDHLIRAWFKTYHLPVIITNCSNNYGSYQYPEKLIPNMILKAVQGKPLPIYGDGKQVRDWIFVDDHCQALRIVLTRGLVGKTYNIGGNCEKTNLEVAITICDILDELLPDNPYKPHKHLITFVEDRPGHDRRYAIDGSKIRNELGWSSLEGFESGLRKTVKWYLEHRQWCENIMKKGFVGKRIGVAG